jgi:putative ABC transport system ATP-binding protein
MGQWIRMNVTEGSIMISIEPVAILRPDQAEDTIIAQEPQTEKTTIIRLQQLSKDYIEAGKRHNVLNALDREFYQSEFVCLLGKSGSGKSTLLNLISGIDAPTGGDVFIRAAGQDQAEVAITALSDHQRTLFRRHNIGIIFQFFNLIPTLTVLENVTLPIELAGGKSDASAYALDLLDRVGLADRIDTYPDKLSGGEQQRVAIARALAHDPLLILADEPTGNLDEDTGESVLSLLLELTRDAGKTLFMATHAPEVARQADRVLHLEHGKLVSDRTQQNRTQQNRTQQI